MRRKLFPVILALVLMFYGTAVLAGSQTTNMKLNKPGKGDHNWGQTVNDNMDKLDAAYGNFNSVADDLPEVYVYTDTFNSTTGTTIALPKSVSAVNEYAVKVTPTSRAGAIGDIYVTKTTTNFTVKCSEANTTDTFSVSIFYIGDVSSYGSSIYSKWHVSRDTGIADHANSSTTGSLAWVQSQIGGIPATVELPGNKNYQLKQSLTIASTIQLMFQKGAIIDTDFSIRDSNYEWYQNGATSEYYLQASGGGNPNINMPSTVIENGLQMTDGAAGSLAAGQWDWNDVNGLGYTTIYVRLSDSTDPDGKSADYVESGYTLTINGSVMAGLYQIISGSGFLVASQFIESIWTPSLNMAIESGAKAVHITPNVTHAITSSIDVASNQTIYGDGDTSLVEVGDNIDAFTIDGKTNITIKDFKIDGKKATYATTSNNAICSPPNGTGSSHIKITGMTIVDVAGNSIEILSQTGSHSENIKILDNTVLDSGACGIVCQDYVDDVMIRGNRVINYGLGVSDRPGIASGRDAVNTQIIGNYVESNGSSLGTSSHGISLDTCISGVVANNIVKGTQGFGIEIALSEKSSVSGNQIYNTDLSGIAISGDDSLVTEVCKTISVVGNTIFEPGDMGIYVYVANYVDTEHEDITIIGNTIHNAISQPGIQLTYVNNGVVSGNTVVDSYKAGIFLSSCSYINVNGNTLKNSDTVNDISHYYGVATSSCNNCVINGFLKINTAGASTSGTGEDTLDTITIPQYFYKDWRGIRLTASGAKTGSAGNKTIKLYWGSSGYTFNAAANDTNDWRIEAVILCHYYTAQDITWLGWNGATPLQGHEDAAEDLSAADVVLKITGECADGADAVSIRSWMLEVF